MRPRSDEIRAELDRILHSGSFQHAERLSRFLRFVVLKTLEGRSEELKEFTVALEVYNKTPDFDPRTDSIVRVEASRLRAKLREHYDSEGRQSRIRIELPKGGYTPAFHRAEADRTLRLKASSLAWIGVLALAAVSVALVAVRMRTAGSARLSSYPRPLTTWSGVEVQPSVSPDGSRVAFVWDGPSGGNFDIYVLPMGGDVPVRLTTDPAADRSPAWSRDGRQIAFIRDAAAGRQLHVMDASGGSVRHVADLTIPAMFPQLNIPRLVEWSKDGRDLLVAEQDTPRAPYSIKLVSIGTGEKRPLTSPPSYGIGDRDPAVSADGRFIAFTRSPSAVTSDIYMMPLAGGEPRRLTFMNQPIRGVAWTEDDLGVVFSSERDATAGSGGLWKVLPARPGAKPALERVAGTGPRGALPSLSRQSGVLVYQESFQDSNIWRVALNGPGRPSPVIASTREESMPEYSPDGNRIAFCSNRSGHWEIWVANADGSNARQLTHFAGPAAAAPRWSADGSSIVFVHHTLDGNSDVHTMNADGSSIRRLTSHKARDERPSWSVTRPEIYFQSNRTGDFEVWKVSGVDPNSAAQVTRGGGVEPVEDPDGRRLYYRKLGSTEIWSMPAGGGPETLVARTGPSSGWVVGRSGVYIAGPDGDVVRINLRDNTRAPIAHLSSPQTMGFALSPDESCILFHRRERAVSDLMVVEGFR